MATSVSQFDEITLNFRKELSHQSVTAHAIDRHELWEEIVQKAIDEGYRDFAERLYGLAQWKSMSSDKD